MTLVLVPPPPQPVFQLPNTPQEWREVIDEIAGKYYAFGATWPNTEAVKVYQKFLPKDPPTQLPPPSKSQTPFQINPKLNHKYQSHQNSESQTERESKDPIPVCVHCECALIEHLAKQHTHYASEDLSSVRVPENQEKEWQEVQTRKWKGEGRIRKDIQDKGISGRSNTNTVDDNWQEVPPFGYIGVSKLSCASCQLWIQGNNTLPGRSFYTRGTHGKWYWPWAMPEMNKDRLSVHMVEKISLAYLKHCRAKFHLRNLSDGSTAAMHDAVTSSDPEVESLMEALLLDDDSDCSE